MKKVWVPMKKMWVDLVMYMYIHSNRKLNAYRYKLTVMQCCNQKYMKEECSFELVCVCVRL